MTIGGAMIFRMDFNKTSGVTEITNSIVAGIKSPSIIMHKIEMKKKLSKFFWSIFCTHITQFDVKFTHRMDYIVRK